MSEYWINGKLTDMTMEEACLKLIDIQGRVERYENPRKGYVDAINIGIEAIHRCMNKPREEMDDFTKLIDDLEKSGKYSSSQFWAAMGEMRSRLTKMKEEINA